MTTTTFDAFLDEERTVAPPPAVDWAARKGQWLQALEDFYARVEEFLQPYIDQGKLNLTYGSITLEETPLGRSAMEAAFRVDYLERVYQRRKDPFSRACRALYARFGHRVPLERELLQLWLTEGAAAPDFIRHLIGALRVRHWLAHGRYWSPRLGLYEDFDTLYTLAMAVSELLAGEG